MWTAKESSMLFAAQPDPIHGCHKCCQLQSWLPWVLLAAATIVTRQNMVFHQQLPRHMVYWLRNESTPGGIILVLRFTTYSSNMSVKHVFSVALNRMLWQMLYCSGTETRGINEAAAPSKTIQGDKNVNVVHCQHGACPLPPTPKKKAEHLPTPPYYFCYLFSTSQISPAFLQYFQLFIFENFK